MPTYSRYKKYNKKCLVAPSYSRYFKYIRVSSCVKCNVYSPSNIEWKELEYTKKKLVDK